MEHHKQGLNLGGEEHNGDHGVDFVKKSPVKIYNNHLSEYRVDVKHSFPVSKTTSPEVFSLSIDPSDKFVACGCSDGTIKVFEMAAPLSQSINIKTSSFLDHRYLECPITSLKWQTHVAVVDEVIDVAQGQDTLHLQKPSEKKINKNLLAVSTDGSFKDVSPELQKCVFQRNDEADELYAIDFDKKGNHFVTAGKDMIIRYYDEATKKLIQSMKASKTIPGHSNRVQCVKSDPEKEELFYTGGWGGSLIVYDVRHEEPVMNAIGLQVSGEAIDVRNHLVVLGGYVESDPVQLWDLRKLQHPLNIVDWNGGLKDNKGEWVSKPEEYEALSKQFADSTDKAFLYGCKFSHDGQFIIAGGGHSHNSVRVFKTDNGQLVSNIHELNKPVLCIDSCKSKDKFAFGTSDSFVKIVDIKPQSSKTDVKE